MDRPRCASQSKQITVTSTNNLPIGIGIFFGTRYVLDEFERAELQLEDQRRHEARRAAFQRQIDYSLPEDRKLSHTLSFAVCGADIISKTFRLRVLRRS